MVAMLAIGTACAALVGYTAFRDYLPPQNAHTYARRLSALPVPRNSQVEFYEAESDWVRSQDAVYLRLNLEPGQFRQLASEARAAGYRPLPAAPTDTPILQPFTAPTASGWYHVVGGPTERKYVIVVLDGRTHVLMAWMVGGG